MKRFPTAAYTGPIGSGAVAPVIHGVHGDHVAVQGATVATALTVPAIYPLAWAMRAHLVVDAPRAQSDCGRKC